jgi:hypothetical protein
LGGGGLIAESTRRARNKDARGSKRVLTDREEEVKVFVSARRKSALFFVSLRHAAFRAGTILEN